MRNNELDDCSDRPNQDDGVGRRYGRLYPICIAVWVLLPISLTSAAAAVGSGGVPGDTLSPSLLDAVQGSLYVASSHSGLPMFHFTRTVERHGSEVVAQLRYDYADGRPAVQEIVTYEIGRAHV